jgi:hypothetical protein
MGKTDPLMTRRKAKNTLLCTVLGVVLLALVGCKEPTMYEKCFAAETGNLRNLTDDELYSRFGYARDLHNLLQETLDQHLALDLQKQVEFEIRSDQAIALAKESLASNPRHQELLKYREIFLGDPHGHSTSDDYLNADKACDADPECFEYWTHHSVVLALDKADPTKDLFERLISESNEIMEGRNWTGVLGKDYEVDVDFEDDFGWHLVKYPQETDEDTNFSELSAEEATKRAWERDRAWWNHWISTFETKKQKALSDFDGAAREICNARGLYE